MLGNELNLKRRKCFADAKKIHMLTTFFLFFLFHSRSSTSTDSGLLKSSPESLSFHLKLNHLCHQGSTSDGPEEEEEEEPPESPSSSSSPPPPSSSSAPPAAGVTNAPTTSSSRQQISLHSLLEALPAASVDTGVLDSRSKRASLSSLSLESRSSDYDSYFYI